MLTTTTPRRHRQARLAFVLATVTTLVSTFLLAFVSPVSAQPEITCPPGQEPQVVIISRSPELVTKTICVDIGDPGDDGDSGGGEEEPTCDVNVIPEYWAGENLSCRGDWACATRVPSLIDEENWPAEGRDEPWSIYTYVMCFDEEGNTVYNNWEWYTPPEPPLDWRARIAYNRLAPPPLTLAFSPEDTTYVGVETFLWAEGPTSDTINGSPPAFGVVAQAYDGRVEVDPGDGSGTIDCGWAVQRTDDCVKTYYDTSAEGGYTAQVRLVFDVRYLVNGVEQDIPGLEDQYFTWPTDWVPTPIPVDEVQVIVE